MLNPKLMQASRAPQLWPRNTLSERLSRQKSPLPPPPRRYTPNDYPSEAEWQARDVIEKSDAAKCPSAAYQLAGAKKVQQDLARPGVVERFVGSPEEARCGGVDGGFMEEGRRRWGEKHSAQQGKDHSI
jgi:hypothetical protein